MGFSYLPENYTLPNEFAPTCDFFMRSEYLNYATFVAGQVPNLLDIVLFSVIMWRVINIPTIAEAVSEDEEFGPKFKRKLIVAYLGWIFLISTTVIVTLLVNHPIIFDTFYLYNLITSISLFLQAIEVLDLSNL